MGQFRRDVCGGRLTLVKQGITVRLEGPLTSELLLFEAL